VSPGYTPAVGKACHDLGLPLLPGVATGSEIMAAQEGGYNALKFFPAMQAGGLAMLTAWHGPFGDVKFCPTGGVNAANATQFLALPNVVCVGGSWLTPKEAVAEGDWARITQLARDAVGLLNRN
jgi:2-dehydro-3-deoxyphosphogluconate aldolase / (4S)-4-hydroxy-2-oxoglutarate aldolase